MRDLIISLALGALASASTTEGAVTAPLHGGAVAATGDHVFETLLTPQGVRVFLYTADGAPALVESATGTARLKLPDGRSLDVPLARRAPAAGEPTAYFCPMHPAVVREQPGECALCGGMVLYVQDHLFGAADLRGVDPARVQALIRVSGLPGAAKDATFLPAFSTPGKKAGETTGATTGR